MDSMNIERMIKTGSGSDEQGEWKQTTFMGMVSQCASMQRVFSLIQRVALSNSTVLILGESGTGKELVARAIHKISGRSGKLVPVNCGAIPEEILESELFGHERGSFTGAVSSKVGRFQLADQGTIFLDEIGEMSPKLQVKLLRVLQERRVDPVGSTRSIEINVRVVAATHKDLREEVRCGRFREDLFYRLQVVPIEIPPLRSRGADAVLLAQAFLDKCCAQSGRDPIVLSEETKQIFLSYHWPGNVRELENLTERLSIVHDGKYLRPQDLPDYIVAGEYRPEPNEGLVDMPPEGVDFNRLVDEFETRLIQLALEKTSGNKKAAADLLRLNRTTLVEKIRKKGLEGGTPVARSRGDDASGIELAEQ